jgi:2-polyprenyl-3-methyl-5-hydroxy-6-metoxy-1,4-benzoquinol methylase
MNKKQNIDAEIKMFNDLADRNEFEVHPESFYEKVFKYTATYINGSVLEVGCGSGAFGARMKKIKPEIEINGIDLSPKLIQLANKKEIYKRLIVDTIEKKELFQEKSIDTIYCPYVLHHIPDLKKTFENFIFWLKPGGYLVIVDPNGSNLILKISYILRLIIFPFLNVSEYVSVNESARSIREFKVYLKKLETLLILPFDHFLGYDKMKTSSKIINLLGRIRNFLIKNFSRGSQIIIVARKR